jgi:hypothetical protein
VADGSSHAKHDRFAIADAAAGAVPAGAAPALIATCPSCGALFIDLLAIRAAVRDARTPSRPRDFLLTTADAARLWPARWRRLLAAIGTQRDAITRPIAVTCTGLGLAGLLLTAVPIGAFDALGGASSAASEAPPEIFITGEPALPPVAKEARKEDPATMTPLTGLSIGLLAAGGAVFAVRRIVPRLGRVR